MHYIARPFHPLWFHQRNIRWTILKLLLCNLCPFMLLVVSQRPALPSVLCSQFQTLSFQHLKLDLTDSVSAAPPLPQIWSFVPCGNWNMRVQVSWSAVVVTMSLFTLRGRFCPSLRARNYIYCRTILGTMPLCSYKGKTRTTQKIHERIFDVFPGTVNWTTFCWSESQLRENFVLAYWSFALLHAFVSPSAYRYNSC